jgi:hypothetical protein
MRNLGIVAISVAMIVGSVITWCCCQHMFWTALDGPTEISLADLANLEDPSQLPSPWVKVKCDQIVETDVAICRDSDNAVVERYLLFPAGDRWMVAVVGHKYNGGKVLEGQVYHSNYHLNVEAFASIYKDYQHIHHGRLFPFEFHGETDYRGEGYSLAAILVFLVGAGLGVGYMGVSGMSQALGDPPPTEPAGQAAAASAFADEALARALSQSGRRG